MANNYQEKVYEEDKEFYKKVINFLGSNEETLKSEEGQEIILECRRKIGYLDFRLGELKKQEESSKP